MLMPKDKMKKKGKPKQTHILLALLLDFSSFFFGKSNYKYIIPYHSLYLIVFRNIIAIYYKAKTKKQEKRKKHKVYSLICLH